MMLATKINFKVFSIVNVYKFIFNKYNNLQKEC